MSKLLKYYKPHIFSILGIFILLFIQTMTDLALPDYMSKIVNDGIVAGDNNYIITVGFQMLGISLLGAVCSVLVGLMASRVGAISSMTIRDDIFTKVEGFSNIEFDKFSTASLITRSTNDVQQVQMFVIIFLRMVLVAPIMGVGGVIRAVQKSSSMTWIIALAVALILCLMVVLFATTMKKFKMIQKMVDRLNLIMRERLTGLMVIRAFNTQDQEQERFEGANQDLTKLNLFVNRAMVVMMPTMMFVMNGISILIVWVGSKAIGNETMQIGDMMAFIQYTMQIIMSFLMVSMIFIFLPRATVAATRIGEVLQTEPVIVDHENTESFVEVQKGFVEFKDVSFKYPMAEEYVLKDINFTAKPGETTAIIGSTGSGKSTLVNLIPRFYDVTVGEILVNGANISHVKQQELREKIGYIPQKGVLFSGTIESNLKYGDETADEELIEKSARIAQATEFIDSKPEKYNEPISQDGTNVSGGQKQRLSIARALVKQADIYIFDDSFSALDFKTDFNLRTALKEELGEATVIIVAQRISTIKNAEKIVVLDEGSIVGMGTHDELMEGCDVYKEIALSQLSKEELA
ncbi:MAG: ABC-type multidrug transport system, ATPase and permease component [Oscillospiraceae bacterium]|nr:ABC-type multidrug transport system, ATPase and permease component [Oscillospiraceae bacterium]